MVSMQGAKRSACCCLKGVRAAHSKIICFSSPIAPLLQAKQTLLALSTWSAPAAWEIYMTKEEPAARDCGPAALKHVQLNASTPVRTLGRSCVKLRCRCRTLDIQTTYDLRHLRFTHERGCFRGSQVANPSIVTNKSGSGCCTRATVYRC